MADTVVLLLNYKAAAMTLSCLRAVRAAADDSQTVLLMDNGSGADQEAQLREGVDGQDRVDLMLLHDNLGYCAAMNRGIEWARERGAEFVVFLNNDVEVESGFLEQLVGVLRNDPGVAGVGPTILRKDGKVWSQGAEVGFVPNLNRLLGEGGAPADRSAGPQAVGYLPGACAVYRLADLLAVKGLDERYFMYFEDALLGHVLRSRGRTLVWLPWVRVTHDASRSSGGGRSPLRKYMTAVNSLRFLREHFRLKLLMAFFLFDCLGLPLAYLKSGPRAGWAKTVGIIDGLRGRRLSDADVSRWLHA